MKTKAQNIFVNSVRVDGDSFSAYLQKFGDIRHLEKANGNHSLVYFENHLNNHQLDPTIISSSTKLSSNNELQKDQKTNFHKKVQKKSKKKPKVTFSPLLKQAEFNHPFGICSLCGTKRRLEKNGKRANNLDRLRAHAKCHVNAAWSCCFCDHVSNRRENVVLHLSSKHASLEGKPALLMPRVEYGRMVEETLLNCFPVFFNVPKKDIFTESYQGHQEHDVLDRICENGFDAADAPNASILQMSEEDHNHLLNGCSASYEEAAEDGVEEKYTNLHILSSPSSTTTSYSSSPQSAANFFMQSVPLDHQSSSSPLVFPTSTTALNKVSETVEDLSAFTGSSDLMELQKMKLSHHSVGYYQPYLSVASTDVGLSPDGAFERETVMENGDSTGGVVRKIVEIVPQKILLEAGRVGEQGFSMLDYAKGLKI